MAIRSLERIVVRLSFLSNSLGNDPLTGNEIAVADTHEKVASSARRPAVTFDERMYPVQAPQRICREQRGMPDNCPILVDNREKLVDKVGTSLKCGGMWLLT